MSEITPFVEVDYLDQARKRYTTQFTDKVVFDKYVQLLIYAQTELSSVFKDLMQLRSLDTAVGAQLDILGDIVGQSRLLLNADAYGFFGFIGVNNARTFGSVGDPQGGGLFYNLGDPKGGNILLDDDTYRLLIKAKIYKNSTASTPEEFIQVINLVFGTTTTQITELGNASINVLIGRNLSTLERSLLTYVDDSLGYDSRFIPKTVGVKVNYGSYDSNNFFGFSEVPGAKGFGDDPRKIISGYGMGYGTDYGAVAYSTASYYDGSMLYDGQHTYNGSNDLSPNLGIGGLFASLF